MFRFKFRFTDGEPKFKFDFALSMKKIVFALFLLSELIELVREYLQ